MTQFHDNEYIKLVKHVLDNGTLKGNRTGINTKSIFGAQMRFDLRDGTIPLLTTKKLHLRSIIHELLWYLQGTGDTKYLHDNNVSIWDEWTDDDGQLGPVYGVQWRHWKTQPMSHIEFPKNGQPFFTCASFTGSIYTYSDEIDQIAVLINTLKTNPDDRRMIVSAWNVADLPDMKLPPCHMLFQCYVANGELSMIMNQRSADVGLGVPFNIVQYSLLLRMLAEVTGLKPGEFIWNVGDAHIYENHIEPLQEQLTRTPFISPTFKFARSINNIDDFKFEDFIINDYQTHPTIKMDVAK